MRLEEGAAKLTSTHSKTRSKTMVPKEILCKAGLEGIGNNYEEK